MKQARNTAALLVALAFPLAWGCGPEFTSCEAKRSCPTTGGTGGGGDGESSDGQSAGQSGGKPSADSPLGEGGNAPDGGARTTGNAGSDELGEGAQSGGGVATSSGGARVVGEGGAEIAEAGHGGAGGAEGDPCASRQCANQATCVSVRGIATCECADGFTGVRCELPRFEWIPRFAGDRLSGADAVNADGTVVVGSSTGSAYRGYRWEKGVLQDVGQFPGYTLIVPTGVSADGLIVVGQGTGPTVSRGFRWEAGTMKVLPPLLGESSSGARAISADGTTVLGLCDTRTVLWRAGQTEDLGAIGTPIAISGDGAVIVGTNDHGAFRWEGGKSVNLPVPAAADSTCTATALTDDALVVFGYCETEEERRSYAWAKSGLVDLGLPPLVLGPAMVSIVSTNKAGTAAVGHASAPDGERAVIWTSQGGMRWLSSVLAEGGVHLAEQELGYATGVSDDGKTVVGWGSPPDSDFQGWIARLP